MAEARTLKDALNANLKAIKTLLNEGKTTTKEKEEIIEIISYWFEQFIEINQLAVDLEKKLIEILGLDEYTKLAMKIMKNKNKLLERGNDEI